MSNFIGELRELRELRGVKQVDVAHDLGVAPASVSEVEHSTNMRLSTLRRYVEALGGNVEVYAAFDDEVYELNLGSVG